MEGKEFHNINKIEIKNLSIINKSFQCEYSGKVCFYLDVKPHVHA